MFTFTHVRALLFAMLLASIAFAPSAAPSQFSPPSPNNVTIEAAPEPPAANSTFYTLRPDMRKCASPMCGGYFIKRVNQRVTRCANGRNMAECYVASIDWNGATEVESKRALVSGSLLTRGNRNGKYGVLKIVEAWQAVTFSETVGEYYRVRDLGVRCIAAPCNTHHEAKLNTRIERNIAGVNLSNASVSGQDLDEVSKAMTSKEGLIVQGSHADVTGPAGRSQTLNATQVYLRVSPNTASKPCIKTGCSGQICSDESVISTCEYRPEYECYKKATCERQANGNCGFTQTPELKGCLARK